MSDNLSLWTYYDETRIEIGVDEAGRGPMFGRVYTGAVILPKDNTFKHEDMKDSKKFSSQKKIKEVAEYIKQNAISWSVTYEDEKQIDKVNILAATQQSMHKAIHNILNDSYCQKFTDYSKYNLLIDGNYFKPFILFKNEKLEEISHTCIKGGDNKYTSIAAASILAKVSRDEYIEALCDKYPKLQDYYSIKNNKGYGTKIHMEGIKSYGISQWHRKTFGICQTSKVIDMN
jgi:ribonuclease HII